LLLVVILALSIALAYTLSSRAQPAPVAQYKVDHILGGLSFTAGASQIQDILNKNAESGWQLVETVSVGAAIVLISRR
jgi:hypothetical protein